MHLDCIRSDYVVEPCQGGIDVGNSTYHTEFSQCWSFNWLLSSSKGSKTTWAAMLVGRADAIRNFTPRIRPVTVLYNECMRSSNM